MVQSNSSSEALSKAWGDIWEKIGNNRLLLVALVGIAVLLGVQLLLAGQEATKPIPNAHPVTSANVAGQSQTLQQMQLYKEALERQLEQTLGQIQGVGKIKVMVSLGAGPEIVPAINMQTSQKTTQEQDSSGGTRTTQENTQNSSYLTTANNQIVTLQEVLPPVTGVVIVAQGASSAEICLLLTRAAQTILDIPAHRVQIYPGK